MRNIFKAFPDWAMEPKALAGLLQKAEAGEEIEPGAVGREDTGLIGVIRLTGPLDPTIYTSFVTQMDHLASDEAVSSIILDINSPGGTIEGVAGAVEAVVRARKKKPVHAYTEGSMASAAYWIGSAATTVSAAELTQLGSIGVLSVHMDMSGMLSGAGITPTVMAAGKFKKTGNPMEPLSEEAREVIQARLDNIYENFLVSVAANRNVTLEAAGMMAEGRVFLGTEAQQAGLIDEVMSRADFMNQIQQENSMNLQDFQANHADLFAEVVGIGREEARAEMEKTVVEARTEERENTLALVQAVVGESAHKAVAQTLKAGVTAEQVEAMKGIFPSSVDEGLRQEMHNLRVSSLEEPVAPAGAAKGAQPEDEAALKRVAEIASNHKRG